MLNRVVALAVTVSVGAPALPTRAQAQSSSAPSTLVIAPRQTRPNEPLLVTGIATLSLGAVVSLIGLSFWAASPQARYADGQLLQSGAGRDLGVMIMGIGAVVGGLGLGPIGLAYAFPSRVAASTAEAGWRLSVVAGKTNGVSLGIRF